ncbi:MAG: VPDSG-CTERM sorting domain-containing protein [Pedosphaera sp.]|nr:VPDSG-CTERM sorting domain-containing protein [Pedosphaera sp.]
MKKTLLTTIAIGLLAGMTAANAVSYTDTESLTMGKGSRTITFDLGTGPVDLDSATFTINGLGFGTSTLFGGTIISPIAINKLISLDAAQLVDLEADGIINIVESSKFGYAGSAKLSAEGAAAGPSQLPNNVPDSGASVGLLGLGLIGLGALRRRLS